MGLSGNLDRHVGWSGASIRLQKKKKIPKWCELSFEMLGHHVSGSSLELQATQSPGSGGLGLLLGKDARGAWRSWGGMWEREARKVRDLGGGT